MATAPLLLRLLSSSKLPLQWPASAPERAKSAASYDSKREGALPFIEALEALEDILKTLLNPVSDFEIRFNLPRKPLEDIAQKLIRASARQVRARKERGEVW